MKNRNINFSKTNNEYPVKHVKHKFGKYNSISAEPKHQLGVNADYLKELIQQLVESAEKAILEISDLSNTDIYSFHTMNIAKISNLRKVLDKVDDRFKQPIAHFTKN